VSPGVLAPVLAEFLTRPAGQGISR
jgi:hypothetical protein